MPFLWCFASGYVPWLSWSENPVCLTLLVLLAPAIHLVHAFLIVLAIRKGPLYRRVHSVHHSSVIPSPWSSPSTHTVEGFVHRAVAFPSLRIPSNPTEALYRLHRAGFSAVSGHIGSDRLELGNERSLDRHACAHYLRSKYSHGNQGVGGFILLDKWFGTWHDGLKAGYALMDERFRRRREPMNATRSGTAAAQGRAWKLPLRRAHDDRTVPARCLRRDAVDRPADGVAPAPPHRARLPGRHLELGQS